LLLAIVERVLDIATDLQCVANGWSTDPACKLSWAQKQWLDAQALEAAQAAYAKAVATQAFAPRTAPVATEWREKVAEDFARWLNTAISTDKMRMGDAEFVEWKHAFLKELP
jgi:CRISPR-associated protein (Cas_Csy1)